MQKLSYSPEKKMSQKLSEKIELLFKNWAFSGTVWKILSYFSKKLVVHELSEKTWATSVAIKQTRLLLTKIELL